MVEKNTWVQIHKIVLSPSQRSESIPDDTKKVPLQMWVKGYLLNNAKLGDEVEIKTITDRVEHGTLVDVNPSFKHNYGQFLPEILQIGKIVKTALYGDKNE